MIRFEDLLEKVRAYNPEADLELLRRAYVFSTFEHKGQVRHSGEPYMVHPLEVADFLADLRLDAVTIAAGLLHDVVEDTLTSIERIEELFGAEVAHVVAGVTKISTIPFSSSEERQAENFRKMLLAMVDDIRVILVKLADRLHNMRTLHHLPEERRLKIAQETLDIYAPIANRLGMSKVKNELEELCFRYLETKGYESLRGRVDARRRVSDALSEELKQTIGAKLTEAQVSFVRIDGRIKRLYSIWQKLRKQKIELEQVYDFVALRIITRSVKDCYATLGIIHNTWSPVPGRIKDFIAMPRPNGYQSLHTSVISEKGMPFEVQIRTEEMHQQAEEGIAAHWKYKEGRVGDQRDERYFQWMRQLLEWQQEVRDPQEFINNLKIDLYPEEVYIFTPKGEVKALPRGATPLDFAYAIHTDVGHRCVGARVNGKMVPLRTRLKNGDIVEIMTQTGHAPSRDWLNFVVTSRARQKIRHFVQQEEKARSIDLGRKLFEKDARRFGFNPKTLQETPEFTKLAEEYGGGKADELTGGDWLRAAGAAHDPCAADARRAAASGEAGGRPRRVGRQAGVAAWRGPDQGQRRRRPARLPRPVLQPDPRREDRRLHQPRQRRRRAFGTLLERGQPDLRSRTPDRRRVGEERRGRGALHRAPDDAGGGPEGDPRRCQRKGGRHQHQHHERRSHHRRGSARPHRHDRADQRSEAPREGDEVAEVGGRRAGRGTVRQVGAHCVRPSRYTTTAITSISTRASRGSRAACTVDRAGAGAEKNVAYTAFIAAKSSMSAR